MKKEHMHTPFYFTLALIYHMQQSSLITQCESEKELLFIWNIL